MRQEVGDSGAEAVVGEARPAMVSICTIYCWLQSQDAKKLSQQEVRKFRSG